MHPPQRNYAYIDSQNLHVAIRHLGWNMDFAKFRVFLQEEYNVERAYIFIGFVDEYTELYADLQAAGFILIFRPTVKARDGTVKGNTDADLVLQAMIDREEYDRAVIVTGDGDFYSLVKYLRQQNKLECLLAPDKNRYSSLLTGAAADRIAFLSDLRSVLAGERKTRPEQDLPPVAEAEMVTKPAPRTKPQPQQKSVRLPRETSEPRRRRRGTRGGRGRRRRGITTAP